MGSDSDQLLLCCKEREEWCHELSQEYAVAERHSTQLVAQCAQLLRQLSDRDEQHACLTEALEHHEHRCRELTEICQLHEERNGADLFARGQAEDQRHLEELEKQQARCSELSEMCLEKEELSLQLARECRNRARDMRFLESQREEQRHMCIELRQEYEAQVAFRANHADLTDRLEHECNLSRSLQVKYAGAQERCAELSLELDEQEALQALSSHETIGRLEVKQEFCEMKQQWSKQYSEMKQDLVEAHLAEHHLEQRLVMLEQDTAGRPLCSEVVSEEHPDTLVPWMRELEALGDEHQRSMEPLLHELEDSLEDQHHLLQTGVREQEEFSAAADRLQGEIRLARTQLADRRECEATFTRLYAELLKKPSDSISSSLGN